MASPGNFSSARRTAARRSHANSNGLLEMKPTARTDVVPPGSHAGATLARAGANYPLPDAVVDVIDRLVDATA
jgi:hypothetical protein